MKKPRIREGKGFSHDHTANQVAEVGTVFVDSLVFSQDSLHFNADVIKSWLRDWALVVNLPRQPCAPSSVIWSIRLHLSGPNGLIYKVRQ